MKILVKLGGTLVDDAQRRKNLAEQIAAAKKEHEITVVHGGGRQLTAFLDERGIASRFVGGLRVTGAETIDGVVKVLAGAVNKHLVAALRGAGANAVGISGVDGRLTTATRMSDELGWVGRVAAADASLLRALLGGGFLPVVACVAGDDEGGIWNINADQMAVACARSWGADRLFFLTDVAGVLNSAGNVLREITAEQAGELIQSGVARGGMQAKLEAARAALQGGVEAVVIAAGTEERIIAKLIAGASRGTHIVGMRTKEQVEEMA